LQAIHTLGVSSPHLSGWQEIELLVTLQRVAGGHQPGDHQYDRQG
jgi:hypothetical protein